MKRAIVVLFLWVRCAGAATVIGNVVLVNEDGSKAKKPDNSGVVVWLEPVGGAPVPPPSSSTMATMDQRNTSFVPHVVAVQVGTPVDFPNSDAIVHNAFSNYDGQVFDLHLYEPKTSKRVVFRRPGMVRVFCNVHADMSGVIAVLPSPYFAVTGMDGRFQIQAPAGNYRLQVWHERGQPALLAGLEQRITVAAEDLRLTEIQVRAGAIQGPHKNKYGQDYFATPNAYVYSPGGRR